MRKNWKKIVSLLLAASMAMSMNVATFAEEIHDEVAEEVVAVEEVASVKPVSGNTPSANDAVAVSACVITEGEYTVNVSYNNILSYTGKAIKVDDLDVEAKVSSNSVKAFSVTLVGKFAKSDAAKGKNKGTATFNVTGVKAVKGATTDQKKAAKAAAKALKKAGNALNVTVKALNVSGNGVVSGNYAKPKEAKAAFEKVSANYLVNVQVNTKKLEKSKVTVLYKQTKKGKTKVLTVNVKNNKKSPVKYTVSEGAVTLTGAIEGVVPIKK